MDDFLEQYSHMEEAASHFLWQSFRDLHQALLDERRGLLFAELIENVDPPEGWEVPKLPDDPIALLREDHEVIPDETADALRAAWSQAYAGGGASGPRLDKNRVLSSVHVAAHVVNIFICVEAVANKRLLFLLQQGKVSNDAYKSLDRADVIPKLLFLFKAQFEDGDIHLGHIRTLASLRNSAVHYRGSSGSSLQTRIKTLIDISREVGRLLYYAEDEPTEKDLVAMLDSALRPHLA